MSANFTEAALAVSPKQREKVRRAIISWLKKKAPRFKVEDIRKMAKAVSEDGMGVNGNANSAIVSIYRSGKMPPLWDSWGGVKKESISSELGVDDKADGAKPEVDVDAKVSRAKLAAAIGSAVTDEDRTRCAHDVARLVALSILEPSEAREIRGPLSEARQSDDAARKNCPPQEDPRRLLMATPEAMEVARALDLMVSDERRERVKRLVAAELEQDLVECPNEDQGGVQ